MPALSGYGDLDMSKNIPWAQRAKDSRLFWRGRTTGNHFSRHHRDWRGSHRISLHNITNSRTSDPVQVLLERKAGILVKEAYPRKKLNERYMDVGLVGKPTQCGNDGTCEEMEKEISFLPVVAGQAGMNSKYVLDVGQCSLLNPCPLYHHSLTPLNRWKWLVSALSSAARVWCIGIQVDGLPRVEHRPNGSVVSLCCTRRSASALLDGMLTPSQSPYSTTTQTCMTLWLSSLASPTTSSEPPNMTQWRRLLPVIQQSTWKSIGDGKICKSM